MSKVSQLSSSLTLATASTSLFLFPSPSQPLSHHSCSASICLSCLSIYLSSHSFNKYSLNSGSVSGTMPSVKDGGKKERKKERHRFSLKESIFHCHCASSCLCHLRPRLWPYLGLPAFSFPLPSEHIMSEIPHLFLACHSSYADDFNGCSI